MLVVRALKNSQLTDGESHVIYGTGHEFPFAQGRFCVSHRFAIDNLPHVTDDAGNRIARTTEETQV